MQEEEEKGLLPKGSAKDALALVSGLASSMMLDAYFEQHVLKLVGKNIGPRVRRLHDKEEAERLAKIILLGIKEYYKDAQ